METSFVLSDPEPEHIVSNTGTATPQANNKDLIGASSKTPAVISKNPVGVSKTPAGVTMAPISDIATQKFLPPDDTYAVFKSSG